MVLVRGVLLCISAAFLLAGQAKEMGDVQQFGPSTMSGVSVTDKPFCAQFEDVRAGTREGPSTITSGTFCRDSHGRTRTDMNIKLGDSLHALILITDPMSRSTHTLDPVSKTGIRANLPGATASETEVTWFFSGEALEVGREVVGDVPCRRFEVKSGANPAESIEVWIAEDLQADLMEKFVSLEGERTWRLFDIDRVVPRASLFEISSEYKILAPGDQIEGETKSGEQR